MNRSGKLQPQRLSRCRLRISRINTLVIVSSSEQMASSTGQDNQCGKQAACGQRTAAAEKLLHARNETHELSTTKSPNSRTHSPPQSRSFMNKIKIPKTDLYASPLALGTDYFGIDRES